MSGRLQPLPPGSPSAVKLTAAQLRGGSLLATIPEPANKLTEALLYFLVIFTPWAFGATESWSMWVLNAGSYFIGILWGLKCLSRRVAGRARTKQQESEPAGVNGAKRAGRLITPILGTLTVLILAYCLVSALNARATYDYEQLQLHYHSCISWLPHSYESASTWSAFWDYLALALIFWAVRDWLLDEVQPGGVAAVLSPRLRRLLWVLCLNGALLGLECLLQRMDGGSKLLWLREPEIHKDAQSQFGPYAYRSNAAQYFTLLWPVALGFWWLLNRMPRRRRLSEEAPRPRAYGVLLPCAMLMLGCAVASLSRAGALVALGQTGVAWLILLADTRLRNRRLLFAVSAIFLLAISLAAYLDWDQLKGRFGDTFHDQMAGRTEIYEHAHRMARDFALLGSGPKTFAPLYEFYFSKSDQYWASQVHNDWLETWITFGAVGMTLILLALAQLFIRYFFAGGIPSPWPFLASLWLGLGGCLVYAIVDFPFQIPSLLFLFVLLGSIAFSSGPRE